MLLVILAVIAASVVLMAKFTGTIKKTETAGFDLDAIRERGTLFAVTTFNSTDYFIYKGEPMGFNYELLKAFAKNMDLDLEILTENNPENAAAMLRSGNADIMAISLPEGTPGMEEFSFTEPLDETRQVLVKLAEGKKPVNRIGKADINKVRDQLGLGKNTIYIQTGYPDPESLMPLASEMGDSIHILDVPYEQEDLIRYVSEGIIDYTVCDENIALVNSTYYSNIDAGTPAGPVRKVGWVMRKHNAQDLLAEFNSWYSEYRKTREYAFLYAEYFDNSRSGIIIKSDYYGNRTGKISVYDDIIRKYSANINWDWRLLASLICQESRFRHNVESGRGAKGLMQIMPETAAMMGIDSTSTAEENIRAGIRYINFLHDIFDPKIGDETERIYFILAAYNAGPGHVLDAMTLAQKNGMDPQKWKDNVEEWMLKKNLPEYYNDKDVKNGYFKGVESVKFVAEIIDRYNHYRNIVPESGKPLVRW